MMRRYFACLLALLPLWGILPAQAQSAGKGDRPFPRKGAATVRIVTYNTGVFTKSGTDRTDMVAAMLREMKADVAGFQELDSCTARTGGVYQLHALAQKLGGWHYRFAPAIPFDGGTYGIGIAARRRWRILDSWCLSLDREDGAEQRALDVVECPRFVLATTHLDHRSDAARLSQAKTVSDTLSARYGGTRKVVVLCGDFNARPDSPVLREMARRWKVVSPREPTYDASRPHACIDYVMVLDNRSRYTVLRSVVATRFRDGDPAVASDHLPVYVDIRPERPRGKRK